MSQADLVWPPLITAKRSFWMRARDFVLTTVMWIVFIVMLEGEFGLVFGYYLDRLGVRAVFERIGFSDLTEGSRLQFAQDLLPYLGMALILVISLGSFAIDTIRRRREALQGPSAPSLSTAIEASHAQLSTMAGYIGETVAVERAGLDLETVDVRSLLIAFNRLDDAALVDARKLRIVNVHVTTDGHYRIQAGA
jgi:hypothetical protein